MGFSTTYTELIILMASIILATSISTYMIYMGNNIQTNIMQITQEAIKSLNTRVEIVYATIINGTEKGYIIYAKNIGLTTIHQYSEIDLYIGAYGQAKYYKYSQTPRENTFTIVDSDGDGAWEPWETAIITVYTNKIATGIIEVKIKPLNGPITTYIFTPP